MRRTIAAQPQKVNQLLDREGLVTGHHLLVTIPVTGEKGPAADKHNLNRECMTS